MVGDPRARPARRSRLGRPELRTRLGPDFAARLHETIAAAPVDVLVAVGPEIARPPESDLKFYDRLFGRILDDLDPADPVVFIYFEPGRAPGVWCYAYGPDGMSSHLVTRGELS